MKNARWDGFRHRTLAFLIEDRNIFSSNYLRCYANEAGGRWHLFRSKLVALSAGFFGRLINYLN